MDTPSPSLQDPIGESPAMKLAVQRSLRFASNENLKVALLIGPTGSGKNLLAKLIHRASQRVKKPFVSVNCAAIPSGVLESELFGHVRGAFTDAHFSRAGDFEKAEGGFIFLNEINETDKDFQVKLLGVFDDWEIKRVGSQEITKLNVRVIVASSKNLENLVESGEFLDALYFRICVIPIVIPPLCQRTVDIPPLIEHFIKKYSGSRLIEISPETLEYLKTYSWPGNAREIENEIQSFLPLNRKRVKKFKTKSAKG